MARRHQYISAFISTLVCIQLSGPALAQDATGGGSVEEQSRALNKEGNSLLTQGKPQEAAEMFRRSIKVNPQSAAAHNNLALVLKQIGQYAEAETEARQALKLRVEKGADAHVLANCHFNLGLILQQERKPEAELSFREAMRQDPMDPEYHFKLAQVLLAQSRPQDAETEVKMAILMKPSDAGYHRLLADSLLEEKKHDAALCEYRTTMELNPQGQDAGDIRNKINYLKQVLNLH